MLHVHSTHSDGSGTVAEILAAAQGAEVDFLVLTDHNTVRGRGEGLEGWQGSVLLIVGEEISTRSGHCLAVGIPGSIPRHRPTEEVIADIGSHGGLSFIAHPHGVYKPFLRKRDHSWKDWGVDAFTGLEIWSYMFDWAQQFRSRRWSECLANPDGILLGPDPKTLSRWDEAGRRRRVVGIGGVDAHARRYRVINRVIFPYHDLFRKVRTHVLAARPLTGDSGSDTASILDAIRAGRCFASFDLLASGTGFRFSSPEAGLSMGGEAPFSGEVGLLVESPRAASLRLIRDGLFHREAEGTHHVFRTAGPGVYRVEARLEGRPWIFSNPIYLRP